MDIVANLSNRLPVVGLGVSNILPGPEQFLQKKEEEDEDEDEIEDDEEEDEMDESTDLIQSSSSKTPLFDSPHLHLVFYVDFLDGYSFRQMFEFFKAQLTYAPLFFTPKGIVVEQGNAVQSFVVTAHHKARYLMGYYVDTERFNLKAEKKHAVNFNLATFQKQIKTIARKDGLRLFQYEGMPYVLAQPYGGIKNGEGHITIGTEQFERRRYKISDFEQSLDEPNCRIPLTEFCSSCNNIARNKYQTAVLKVYPKGLSIHGESDSGIVSRVNHWGDCQEPKVVKGSSGAKLVIKNDPGQSVYTVRMSLDVTKGMAKAANLANNAIMRIHCEADGLCRLFIPIGCTGKMTCYLLDDQAASIGK